MVNIAGAAMHHVTSSSHSLLGPIWAVLAMLHVAVAVAAQNGYNNNWEGPVTLAPCSACNT